MSKVVCYLYLFFLLVLASAIGYSGFYLLDMLWDSLIYTFGKTGWEYAYDNYFKINGRWAQGLTNDLRLYSHKGFSILFTFLLLLYALYRFFRVFVDKKTEALVLTGAMYIALFLTLGRQYYDFTFNLSNVLSYTLGLSLLLLLTPLLIGFKDFKSKKLMSVGIILAIAFLCGLLEIHGVLVLLLCAVVIGRDYLLYKQVQKSHLIFLGVAILSNMLVFFSPGNQVRRKQSGSTIEFDLVQLQELFVRNLKDLIDINVLVFMVVAFVISIMVTRKMNKREWMGSILLLPIVFLTTILPLLLIVMAAPDRAMHLGRVENVSFFLMTLFLFLLAYLLGAFFRGVQIKKVPYHLILMVPLVSFSISVLDRREVTEAEKTFTQIYFGDLEKYYYREMAIRDYLLDSEKGIDKTIPALLDEGYRHSVIGLPNGFKYKDRQHRTYERLLNGGRKIFLRYDFPDPACFTSIYFFEKGSRDNLTLIYESPVLDVFRNEKYKTVLAIKKGAFNKRYKTIPIDDSNYYTIHWEEERMRYPEYYSEHPNIICLPNQEFEGSMNKESDFVVQFNASYKLPDEVQLYLKETGLPYGQGNAIRQSVPKGEDQQVTFIIPPSGGVPQNLRFDFASVPQQEVTIHEMELSKGDVEVRIPSNELLKYFNSPEKWNVVLDKDSAKFGVKEINQFVDAQLKGNQKLDSLLKQILKPNREKNP